MKVNRWRATFVTFDHLAHCNRPLHSSTSSESVSRCCSPQYALDTCTCSLLQQRNHSQCITPLTGWLDSPCLCCKAMEISAHSSWVSTTEVSTITTVVIIPSHSPTLSCTRAGHQRSTRVYPKKRLHLISTAPQVSRELTHARQPSRHSPCNWPTIRQCFSIHLCPRPTCLILAVVYTVRRVGIE